MTRPRALGLAVLVALGLLLAGRQITWHADYAPSGGYRAQVAALLDGELALSHAPEAIQHDYAWTDRGVQQVWGLGVPLWQAPFELIGRAVGLSPFPDRIALLAFLVVMAYVLIRGFRDDRRWVGAGSVVVTALLPAFVTILRGRIGVYEEAAIYAYAAAMILLGATARLATAPTRWRYLVVLAVAGLVAFVRPTAWCYGFATAIVASVIWLREHGRRGLVEVSLGAALFVAGGAALYATNLERFGAGMEFGHHVNLQGLSGSLYATRFSHPFERAGAVEAATELAGGLFDRPELRARGGYYQKHLHRGVSTQTRWREFYFTTFTWWYVPALLAGLVLGVRAWRRRDGPRWLVVWAVIAATPLVVYYLHAPGMTSRYQLDLAPAFAALLVIAWQAAARRWGAIAAGVLAAAWLACIVTARVAPRFGANPVDRTIAEAAADEIRNAVATPRVLPAAYDLADPWLPSDTNVLEQFDRCSDEAGTPIDPDGMPLVGDTCLHGERAPDSAQWIVWRSEVGAPPPELCWPAETVCWPEPTAATAGDVVETVVTPPSLFLDLVHWDLATGQMPPATFAWIEDPAFLELDVATLDGTASPFGGAAGPAQVPAVDGGDVDWAREVRVAIGREHLRLVSIADTERGVRLRFEGHQLGRGLQIAFLAFGADRDLDQPRTRFAVRAIRWRPS